MIHALKTLAEIIHDNPDARAYWAGVAKAIGARHDAAQAAALDCPTCGGLGYVRASNLPPGHPKFGQLFPCPDSNCPVRLQQERERYDLLTSKAQIPAGYKNLTFDQWQNLYDYPDYLKGKQDALGAALAFVAARERDYWFTLDDAAAVAGLDPQPVYPGARNSIVFYGRTGVGKTSLAIAIMRFLLDNRSPVVYLQLKQFFDHLKKTFEDDAEEAENEVLTRYQHAPVLVIDEFDTDVTDWRKGRAYDLVNYRYANHLPTVITTNYSADELIAAWGMQTGHRLQAMAHWIEVGGLELRQRNATVKSR